MSPSSYHASSVMVGLCQKNTLMLVFLLRCLWVEEVKGKNILGSKFYYVFFFSAPTTSGRLTVIPEWLHLLFSHLDLFSIPLSHLLKVGIGGHLELRL